MFVLVSFLFFFFLIDYLFCQMVKISSHVKMCSTSPSRYNNSCADIGLNNIIGFHCLDQVINFHFYGQFLIHKLDFHAYMNNVTIQYSCMNYSSTSHDHSILKGSIYHIKHMSIQPFTMEVD